MQEGWSWEKMYKAFTPSKAKIEQYATKENREGIKMDGLLVGKITTPLVTLCMNNVSCKLSLTLLLNCPEV